MGCAVVDDEEPTLLTLACTTTVLKALDAFAFSISMKGGKAGSLRPSAAPVVTDGFDVLPQRSLSHPRNCYSRQNEIAF